MHRRATARQCIYYEIILTSNPEELAYRLLKIPKNKSQISNKLK
ncbi:hypothetical protein D1BOALGB6SA_6686 [Olavius sp. associated proteobacterium Delta 1]|nr:hypothetical protein D1BOALGB6SA_6686 [Olavius sp. associated proteobacterium Delta 1]